MGCVHGVHGTRRRRCDRRQPVGPRRHPCAAAARCGRWYWKRLTVRAGRGRTTTTGSRRSRPRGTASCRGCRSPAPIATAVRTVTRSSPPSPPMPTIWTPRSAPPCRVSAVLRTAGGFEVELEGGGRLSARAVVAASGTFGPRTGPRCRAFRSSPAKCCTLPTTAASPVHRPPGGCDRGRELREADRCRARRTARVTLATSAPVTFAPPRVLRFSKARTGLDTALLDRFLARPPAQPVLDDGRYRAAPAGDRPERRPLFTGADGPKLLWPDGQR